MRSYRGFLLVAALLWMLSQVGCSTDKSAAPDVDTGSTQTGDTQDTEETEGIEDTEDTGNTGDSEDSEDIEETESEEEEVMLKIEVNGEVLYADFENHSSAEALKEKLAAEPLTLDMHDYGSFEKVGDLPWTLPRNDKQITTQPGDVILYLGNELTIYYDTNSWNFTRVAKIRDVDGKTLKQLLGDGNVTVTFSVE